MLTGLVCSLADWMSCAFLFQFETFMCLSPVCAYHVSADGVQKRVSDPLELELQAVLSRLTWVLGTNLESLQEQ